MERQNRTITVASLVLIALVAVVVLDKDREPKTDFDAPPEHAAFEGLTATDVTALSLVHGTETLTFERKDGAWTLVKPRELRVDDRKVQEVVDRLATLRLEERTLSADRKGYGLDAADRVEVRLTRADGSVLDLWVGNDAKVGYDAYVTETADGPVLLAKAQLRSLVARTVDDFRDRKAWRVSAGTATRVVIEDARSGSLVKVEASKDTAGLPGWRLADGTRVDEDAIAGWLSRASTVNATGFGDGKDLAELGLAQPRASITVVDADGTHVLRFGTESEPGSTWGQGDGDAVLVGTDATELLAPKDWVLTRAIPLHRFTVDRIEATLDGTEVRLTKTDGTWTRADGGTVGDIQQAFDALDAIKAERAAGNAPPEKVVGTLRVAEGDRSLTIELGPAREGWHAAREVGGPPYRIDAATLQAALQTLGR
jgi:hypothetical protein